MSLHCPRDASTLKMMNADAFARMKQGAIFITTARGGIHDEAALVQALRSGHLAGAGIDVWDQEPPPLDHPLLAMDNVFATFHTAGVTHEGRRNVAAIGAEQIVGAAGRRAPAAPGQPRSLARVREAARADPAAEPPSHSIHLPRRHLHATHPFLPAPVRCRPSLLSAAAIAARASRTPPTPSSRSR